VGEFVGGYSDWLRQRPASAERGESPARRPRRAKRGPTPQTRRRIGYKQIRELASLPARIEALEAEVAELQAKLADPALYKKGPADIAGTRETLSRVQSDLETTYERWTQLEALAQQA
jgi:ATP-binding cassette subfamily F protein uup